MTPTDYWETPPDFFKRMHNEFRFTVDGAACAQNAKLSRYWGDALTLDWSEERVWLNPPYSLPLQAQFLAKCHVERDRAGIIVALVPANPDTAHWHDYVMKASEIRFLRGRLWFLDTEGVQQKQPKHKNALVIWRPRQYRTVLGPTVLPRL